MAGHGIEYCWGYGEMMFLTINDQSVNKLESFVTQALSSKNLALERIWKYQRRTRDYMRMYKQMESNLLINPRLKEEINHQMLEKKRKDIKKSRLKQISSTLEDHLSPQSYHRNNIAVMERRFIGQN